MWSDINTRVGEGPDSSKKPHYPVLIAQASQRTIFMEPRRVGPSHFLARFQTRIGRSICRRFTHGLIGVLAQLRTPQALKP